MLLIDGIVDFDADAQSVVAEVRVKPEWAGSHVAIEYMAQTAAALVGLNDKVSGTKNPARPGFLLGTRRLDLKVPSFEVGRRYLVSAKVAFADGEAASFECEMRDGDAVVASAILNAYRPEDVEQFLKEQSIA